MMSGVWTERSAAGFTLLEVLFVVFIVGLLTSLLAPRIGASLSSFEAVSQRRLIEDQLLQLPRRVRYIGRGLELPRDQGKKDIGDGAPALQLPEGWTADIQPPLVISPVGACSAAVIKLVCTDSPGASARYGIHEISCEIEKLADVAD